MTLWTAVSPEVAQGADRLTSWLEEQIHTGRMTPGQRIASERKLSETHGLPLHAVRLAIRRLRDAGLLVSRPKSGVFVSKGLPAHAADHGTAFTAMSAARPAFLNPSTMDGQTRSASQSQPGAGVAPGPFSEGHSGGISGGKGFQLFDVVPGVLSSAVRTIQFAVGAWHESTWAIWRQVCQGYSMVDPAVRVEPLFPENHTQYLRMQAHADIYTGTPNGMAKSPGQMRQAVTFSPQELLDVGVAPRYVNAVTDHRGRAYAVPLNATLLVGLLDAHHLSADQLTKLDATADLLDALDLLSDSGARPSPGVLPTNFTPVSTFNPMQFMYMQGRPFMEAATRAGKAPRMLTDSEPFVTQMRRLKGFLDRHPSLRAAALIRDESLSCLSLFDFTYRGLPGEASASHLGMRDRRHDPYMKTVPSQADMDEALNHHDVDAGVSARQAAAPAGPNGDASPGISRAASGVSGVTSGASGEGMAGRRIRGEGRYLGWAAPLGPQGRYVEGINVGAINPRSRNQDDARRFLLYLASAAVQQTFTRLVREYPISTAVADPFAGLPGTWGEVVRQCHAQGGVMYEVVPGYSYVMEYVHIPAVRAWFLGQMTTEQFCSTVTTQGNEVLAAAAARA